MTHSPLPWRVQPHEGYMPEGWGEPVEIADANGNAVACNTAFYPTAITADNAEFIVSAVNRTTPTVAAQRCGLDEHALDVDALLQPLDDIYTRDGFCDWADVANARDEIRRALSALPPSEAGWREMPAPDLERVVVAGWQQPQGMTRGYWWYHEDCTDDTGKPMDHPEATLWIRMSDLLPAFPAAPDRRAGE